MSTAKKMKAIRLILSLPVTLKIACTPLQKQHSSEKLGMVGMQDRQKFNPRPTGGIMAKKGARIYWSNRMWDMYVGRDCCKIPMTHLEMQKHWIWITYNRYNGNSKWWGY